MTGTRHHESAVDRIRERVEEKAARRAAAAGAAVHVRRAAAQRCERKSGHCKPRRIRCLLHVQLPEG